MSGAGRADTGMSFAGGANTGIGEGDGEVLTARQAALAAELRALYGYALLGPRLAAADQPLVGACLAAHSALRDATVTALLAARAVPVAPRPDYPDLYPVPDAATARVRAVELEQTCAAAWRFLYARLASSGPAADRPRVQQALTDSAVRATRWRVRAGTAPATVAFPGIA